jgi:hypothetical protein
MQSNSTKTRCLTSIEDPRLQQLKNYCRPFKLQDGGLLPQNFPSKTRFSNCILHCKILHFLRLPVFIFFARSPAITAISLPRKMLPYTSIFHLRTNIVTGKCKTLKACKGRKHYANGILYIRTERRKIIYYHKKEAPVFRIWKVTYYPYLWIRTTEYRIRVLLCTLIALKI